MQLSIHAAVRACDFFPCALRAKLQDRRAALTRTFVLDRGGGFHSCRGFTCCSIGLRLHLKTRRMKLLRSSSFDSYQENDLETGSSDCPVKPIQNTRKQFSRADAAGKREAQLIRCAASFMPGSVHASLFFTRESRMVVSIQRRAFTTA